MILHTIPRVARRDCKSFASAAESALGYVSMAKTKTKSVAVVAHSGKKLGGGLGELRSVLADAGYRDPNAGARPRPSSRHAVHRLPPTPAVDSAAPQADAAALHAYAADPAAPATPGP
jgi:hypothetical protein